MNEAINGDESKSRLVSTLDVVVGVGRPSEQAFARLSVAQHGEVPVIKVGIPSVTPGTISIEGVLKFRAGYYTLPRGVDEPIPSITVEPVWNNDGERGLLVTDVPASDIDNESQ